MNHATDFHQHWGSGTGSKGNCTAEPIGKWTEMRQCPRGLAMRRLRTGSWRATKSGVYFTDNDAKPHPALKVFHEDPGVMETVAALDKESWGNPRRQDISLYADRR